MSAADPFDFSEVPVRIVSAASDMTPMRNAEPMRWGQFRPALQRPRLLETLRAIGDVPESLSTVNLEPLSNPLSLRVGRRLMVAQMTLPEQWESFYSRGLLPSEWIQSSCRSFAEKCPCGAPSWSDTVRLYTKRVPPICGACGADEAFNAWRPELKLRGWRLHAEPPTLAMQAAVVSDLEGMCTAEAIARELHCVHPRVRNERMDQILWVPLLREDMKRWLAPRPWRPTPRLGLLMPDAGTQYCFEQAAHFYYAGHINERHRQTFEELYTVPRWRRVLDLFQGLVRTNYVPVAWGRNYVVLGLPYAAVPLQFKPETPTYNFDPDWANCPF